MPLACHHPATADGIPPWFRRSSNTHQRFNPSDSTAKKFTGIKLYSDQYEGTHRLVHGPTGTQRPLRIVVQPIPHGAAPVPERLERPHGSLLGRHLAPAFCSCLLRAMMAIWSRFSVVAGPGLRRCVVCSWPHGRYFTKHGMPTRIWSTPPGIRAPGCSLTIARRGDRCQMVPER